MKKYMGILLLCLFFLLLGCTETVQENNYTAEAEGKKYSLTLRSDNTFLLTETEGEGEQIYEGTYVLERGTYVLEGETLGKKTVIAEENSFRFIADFEQPAEEEPKKEEEPSESVCPHDWSSSVYTPAKNCLEKGNTLYTCSLCGETKLLYSQETGAHDYKEEIADGKNCLAKKVKVFTCKLCGHVEKEETENLSENHAYQITEETDGANCLNNVKTKYQCTLCKAVCYKEYDETLSGGKAHIGAHTYQNGFCTTCGYNDNGFSTVHIDKDGNGACDNCLMNMNVVDGVAKDGYFLEGDILYMGAFPQQKSSIKAETIKKEGRYDINKDCYYYKNETYVLRKNSREISFADGTQGTKGTEEVFILTPIQWDKTSDGTYVCRNVLDGKKFTDEVQIEKKDGSYYSRLEITLADNYAGSTIKRYMESTVRSAFSTVQSAFLTGISLCTVAESELLAQNKEKKATDYALAGGIGIIDDNICAWYLADLVHTEVDDGKYVSYMSTLQTVGQCAVTDLKGVVPMITVQFSK